MTKEYCYKCMMKLADGHCPDCGADEIEVSPHHLKPGTVLQGKYLIGYPIGAGGFGITYIGRDLVLDTRIALKEYYPSQNSVRNSEVSPDVTVTAGVMTTTAGKATFEKSKERFLDEARTLARFEKDAGIVRAKDFFEANNTAYIVMEYVDGLTLKEYLEQNGNFSADEIVSKMRPVMESLARVHEKGLVHRDISPDNIKMPTEGNLKLLDFGAARFISADLDKTVTSMTKAGYAPEEQYRSGGEQGPWTDVYALCATIYKCVTGETPPDAPQRLHNKTRNKQDVKAPSELGAAISPQLEAVIMRGMGVLQEDRYQSMDELLAALDGNLESESGGAISVSSLEDNDDAPVANEIITKQEAESDVMKRKKSGWKKALRSVLIAAAFVAAVLTIFTITNNAGKVTIAGERYDKSVTRLGISGKFLSKDDLKQITKLSSLTSLTLTDCGLDSEIAEAIATLEKLNILDLSGNPGITDLSALSDLSKLRYVTLDSTGIQDISFLAGNTGLSELSLNDCSITDISPIAQCEQLKKLSLGGNLIEELSPLGRLIKLTYLDLSRNKIQDISGMGNCAVLEHVNLADNQIENIDVLGKSADTLKSADVSRNPLDNSTVSKAFCKCTVMEILTADQVGISGSWRVGTNGSWVDKILPDTKQLSLAGNEILYLEFESDVGKQLEALNVSKNASLLMLTLPEVNAWKRIDVSNTSLTPKGLTISASTYESAKLVMNDCGIIDLQNLPADMAYELLDIRSDKVASISHLTQLSGYEINIKYNDNSDSFDAKALADSPFKKINVYDAPLDVQEKIRRELSGKVISFFDDDEIY